MPRDAKHTPLLPCPFCGGKAQVYKAFPKFKDGWHVDCDHADDCVICDAHGTFQGHTSAKSAAAAWNRRAPHPAFEPMRQALERLGKHLDCGCSPCKGQCRSAETLLVEIEARQEIARAALKLSEPDDAA